MPIINSYTVHPRAVFDTTRRLSHLWLHSLDPFLTNPHFELSSDSLMEIKIIER